MNDTGHTGHTDIASTRPVGFASGKNDKLKKFECLVVLHHILFADRAASQSWLTDLVIRLFNQIALIQQSLAKLY